MAVRINDPLVVRVQLFRSLLGLPATLALAFYYGRGEQAWHGAASDGFGNLIITPVLLIVTGPLVVMGFILYAPPHLRPMPRSRLKAPLRTVAWYVLSVAVCAAVIVYAGTSDYLTTLHKWAAASIAFVVLAVIVWGLPFLFLASFYSAKSAFNTAHVHPMLPGVLTAVLIWAVSIFNLIVEGRRKARSRRNSAPCWAARCRSRRSPCGSCGGCEPATESFCVADLGRIAVARRGVDSV
ncbi:hypothetical protein ACWGDS_18130 [Streptomyces sp. NPDC055059]|uniref:hypothetical protein n=1 Tax=Streptomyces sp. NPDC127172 TaxID=3345382 RepID=UPI003636B887